MKMGDACDVKAEDFIKIRDDMRGMMKRKIMKVYIISDLIFEQIIAVYKSEKKCLQELDKLNKSNTDEFCLRYTYEDFEVIE